MALFEHFPYANFHEMNMDAIAEYFKAAEAAVAESAEDAAEAAEAAAASEAAVQAAADDMAAANARATTALANSSTALTKSTTALNKTNKHSFYEFKYDTVNEAITVTDLYSGEVVSSESEPAVINQFVNTMIDRDSNQPPIYGADYLDNVAPVTPMVKFVYISAIQSAFEAFASVSVRGLSGIDLIFWDPLEQTVAALQIKPASGEQGKYLTFAHTKYTLVGTPEVSAEDNGKYLMVEDGEWAAVARPQQVLKVENGELPASWGELRTWLRYYHVMPCIYIDDPDVEGGLGNHHVTSAILAETWYNRTAETHYAKFITSDENGISYVLFYSADQTSNMILD